ncbi:hypothetical protein ACQUSR_19745 [Streptomyces sp. P1-3]|uniref:hypothetical protein n=1 Tax=Streptomyces sp. P1-3 TaxID=3421658 RepID=UPI003D368E46
MKTHARRIRRVAMAVGALALTSATVTGAVPAGAAAGTSPTGSPSPVRQQTQRIATSTLGKDLQVTLTAVRSTKDQLAATVDLSTFTQVNGEWRLQDKTRVGQKDSWFWFPLTGSQAVCEFSTASAAPQRIRVSLLVTPSIGCSPVHRFHLENGKIVTG